MRTITAALAQVAHAVAQLHAAGHAVLRVELSLFAPPSIDIKPVCEGALRGVPTREEVSDGSFDEYLTTTLGGCRVRWRQ